MSLFVTRWDFRCPPSTSTPRQEQYAAALDQAAYCDQAGFDSLVLSEHHGVEDGFLPSPLVVAAAIAARTSRIAINIAALLVPLHDPLRLAEDIAVLDHLSGGRISYVLGLGYRREEYDMFGRDWAGRGQLIERTIQAMLQAWTGEPFEHEGRTVQVTPRPASDPHPIVFYGGGSVPAARRAARLGLGFYPQSPDESLAQRYLDECAALGREPGMVLQPPAGPGTVFCANDPDAFWEQWGEILLADAQSYAAWQRNNPSLVTDTSSSVEEMRAAGVYVVWTPEALIERCRSGEIGLVTSHPLCGGLPPEVGWESLRLIGEQVIPAVRGT